MQKVLSLHPYKNQMGVNPWQLQYIAVQPSWSTSSAWTSKKLFNLLHNEHEQHRMVSAERPDMPCEAAARQNLVSALSRNSEAPYHSVWMQVRQLENEADARLSQRQRELLSRCSQHADQALED